MKDGTRYRTLWFTTDGVWDCQRVEPADEAPYLVVTETRNTDSRYYFPRRESDGFVMDGIQPLFIREAVEHELRAIVSETG